MFSSLGLDSLKDTVLRAGLGSTPELELELGSTPTPTPELELELELKPPELELELIFWRLAGVGVGVGVETLGVGLGVGVDIQETCRSWSWSWSWNSRSWSWNWSWNSRELELELKFCKVFLYIHIFKHSVESPSMVDPQWNIWYWGSKWNLHTVCWSAVGCEWGTTSVYFGITYVCFIPSRLPVFAVEPQYLLQYLLFLSKVSFELHIHNLQKISCWFEI